MDAINLYEAKTQLSKLVDEAAGGKDVVLSRHGKPVACLTSLKAKSSPVVFGVLKGKVTADAALKPYSELVLLI